MIIRKEKSRKLVTSLGSQKRVVASRVHGYLFLTLCLICFTGCYNFSQPRGTRSANMFMHSHQRKDARVLALDYNALVEQELKIYLRNRARSVTSILKRGRADYPDIQTTFRNQGLPVLLSNIAVIESAYSPKAISPAGARGLWQFTADTGRAYGLKVDKRLDERTCPVKSTRAATALLRRLHSTFGDWNLALAAYNGGEWRIKKALEKSKAKDFWSLARSGMLPRETSRFVPKFIAVSIIDLLERKYGQENIEGNLIRHIASHSGRRTFALNHPALDSAPSYLSIG